MILNYNQIVTILCKCSKLSAGGHVTAFTTHALGFLLILRVFKVVELIVAVGGFASALAEMRTRNWEMCSETDDFAGKKQHQNG